MKHNLFFAAMTMVFFACSSDSSDNPDTIVAEDINSQLYIIQIEQWKQCNKEEACVMNVWNNPTLYTGSGVLKNIVEEYEDLEPEGEILVIKDISNVGTVVNGKIYLDFNTPKYISENNLHSFYKLMLYDNSDKPIGRLILKSFNSLDDASMAFYVYSSKNMEIIDSYDLFPNQNVIFVYDVKYTKGWNMFYENDRYSDINGERTLTITRATNPNILNGGELRWLLLDPDAE